MIQLGGLLRKSSESQAILVLKTVLFMQGHSLRKTKTKIDLYFWG